MKRSIICILCIFFFPSVHAQKSDVDSLWIRMADSIRTLAIENHGLRPDEKLCLYTMGGYKFVLFAGKEGEFREIVLWRDRPAERKKIGKKDRKRVRRLFEYAEANPGFEYSNDRYHDYYYTMMYFGVFDGNVKIFEFVLPNLRLGGKSDRLKYPLPEKTLTFLSEKLLLEN